MNAIGHFTVVRLVTWPWMQARVKVTLIQTSLLFSCKCQLVGIRIKGKRSLSKRGHLQPRCHLDARSLSRQHYCSNWVTQAVCLKTTSSTLVYFFKPYKVRIVTVVLKMGTVIFTRHLYWRGVIYLQYILSVALCSFKMHRTSHAHLEP